MNKRETTYQADRSDAVGMAHDQSIVQLGFKLVGISLQHGNTQGFQVQKLVQISTKFTALDYIFF